MASCVGRNLFTCSERYDVPVNGIVHSAFNGHSVKSLSERRTPLVYYSSALATLELLMTRRGKGKGKSEHLYSALHGTNHSKALRHGSHSF